MKYFELFDEARNHIPEHEARELLLWASNQNMAQLLARFTDDADDKTEQCFHSAVNERADGKPLQYITHNQNFCGLDFYVDENVLIPRYDTEVLVEKVLEDTHQQHTATDENTPNHKQNDDIKKSEVVSLLDICTGSGCIAVALAKLGGFQVTAGDISRNALMIADRNAQANGVEITFYESDMFEQIADRDFDIIVSNPPYVRRSVIETLGRDVKDFEPRLALDGDEDGLKFYRIIAEKAPEFLKRGGRLYLEIGYDQAEEVKALLEKNGFHDVTVTKDLSGLDRVVRAEL